MVARGFFVQKFFFREVEPLNSIVVLLLLLLKFFLIATEEWEENSTFKKKVILVKIGHDFISGRTDSLDTITNPKGRVKKIPAK